MKVTDADNGRYWDNVQYWEDRGHGGCRVVSGVSWRTGRGSGSLFWLYLQYTDCRLHSFNPGIAHPKGNLRTCTAQTNLPVIAVLGFFFVIIIEKKLSKRRRMKYIVWQLKSTKVYEQTRLGLKDRLLWEETKLQYYMNSMIPFIKEKTKTLYICTGSSFYVNAPKVANAELLAVVPPAEEGGGGGEGRGRADFHFLLCASVLFERLEKNISMFLLNWKRKQKKVYI